MAKPKKKNSNRVYTSSDVPRSDDFSFQDPAAIYTAVGRAVSEWQNLHSALLSLFGRLIRANGLTMHALGYAVLDVGVLKTMIEGALQRSGTVEIAHFLEEVLRFAKLRNFIAHGCVARYANGKDSGYFLRPSETTSRHMFLDNPQYRWTPKELDIIAEHFKRLQRDCVQFDRQVHEANKN